MKKNHSIAKKKNKIQNNKSILIKNIQLQQRNNYIMMQIII